MVNIHINECARGSCKRPASNGVVVCNRHSEDDMIHVSRRRCSRDLCAEWPSFNFEGSTKPTSCMYHAEDGMVNARRIIGARSVMERKDLDDNDVEAVSRVPVRICGGRLFHP